MNQQLLLLPYVFVGGGFGASLRWLISLLTMSYGLKSWIATVIVNIAGTTIYFLLAKSMSGETIITSHMIRIGILGSLTTFSTFSYELVTALKSGNVQEAALIFSLNVIAGVLIGIGILR